MLSLAEQGILPTREQDARTSRKIREQSPNGNKRSARHSTHARSFQRGIAMSLEGLQKFGAWCLSFLVLVFFISPIGASELIGPIDFYPGIKFKPGANPSTTPLFERPNCHYLA